ncbi:MAG: hypothetical protein K2M94_05770 [Paramuribaculum sp.]|nr:hypothetical protein [Paramuribaculum sp.]
MERSDKKNTALWVVHRIMAHRIIYQGHCYDMHVATIYSDGSCSLEPFVHETPNTQFCNGTITINKNFIATFVP